MSRLLEVIAPARLGTQFRYLLASTWASNLGDGIGIAAGPLLVASQTRDPALVAAGLLLQQLPWLLFGLVAGGLADRLNRRLVVAFADLTRAGILVLLVLALASGTLSVPLTLGALFLLGTAEVFADSTSGTLLPMLVERDDLAVGNARMMSSYVTVNQLVGPPIGAALFAVGATWAFASQAVLIALGAVLILRMTVPLVEREPALTRSLRHEIAEGFTWVVHHAAVRTLVLTIFIFNLTYGAAWSVLVLYAQEQLGLRNIGYGLLTSVIALGGLAGTAIYGPLSRRVSLGNIMRIGLVIETLTHLGLALTHSPWVAGSILFVFGAHAFIWGTTSITIRQRAVPTHLQGRVGSVNSVSTYGSLVLGAALGGAIARQGGVAAPFWFAFVGSAVFVVVIWRQLRHLALTEDTVSA